MNVDQIFDRAIQNFKVEQARKAEAEARRQALEKDEAERRERLRKKEIAKLLSDADETFKNLLSTRSRTNKQFRNYLKALLEHRAHKHCGGGVAHGVTDLVLTVAREKRHPLNLAVEGNTLEISLVLSGKDSIEKAAWKILEHHYGYRNCSSQYFFSSETLYYDDYLDQVLEKFNTPEGVMGFLVEQFGWNIQAIPYDP